MFAKFKKTPLFPKIVFGSLVFMIVYGISHRRDDSAAKFGDVEVQDAQNGRMERIDRKPARGMSFYSEENGTLYELPTRQYYFHDRNSGRIVSSNIPDPPNDGRDYDPLTAKK